MTMPLFDDAAPRPGQDNGAGVNDPNYSPDSTLARLPLTPPARHNAPAGTSGVAADRIAGHAAKLRDRVYGYIVSRGADGATDDEAETALGIKCQTYTPRRGELVALRLVVDSARRRNTASGRPAAVWIASEFAGKPEGGGR